MVVAELTWCAAGYFMLAHADRIICSPTTITGSIGAFAGKFALRGMAFSY